METVIAKITARVKALVAQPITLRMQRDGAGNLVAPKGASCMFKLDFTIPELREAGATVEILTEDGRPMSDDEYAAALQAELRQGG